jgi:predicted Zn finger-like uncharacterized protein
MIVQCPKCKTSYKVADELFKDSSPAFRCSRCKHTFQLESPEPVPKPAVKSPPHDTPPAESHEAGELSFIFPAKEEPENVAAEAPVVAAPTGQTSSLAAENDHPDQWAISGNEQKSEAPFTISEDSDPTQKIEQEKISAPLKRFTPVVPENPPVLFPDDHAENILRLGSYRDQQATTTSYLSLFGLLIIIFALVTAFNQAHPTATEGYIRQIPLVGTSVLKNNHLKDGVLLQSLRGGYQSIQGNREVFVITGAALNQNSVTIRAVQISGHAFNHRNDEMEKQTIWVGNAISPSIVRGMTMQEISNLQKLPPLRSFEIPPGDSVPFTIVLLKAPKGMKDFGCQVISAEGEV